MSTRIIRKRAVLDRTGLSNSTLYELINAKLFPPPVPLSARTVGWVEGEIEAWNADRIAKRDLAIAAKEPPAPVSTDNLTPKKRGRPRKQQVAEPAATIAA